MSDAPAAKAPKHPPKQRQHHRYTRELYRHLAVWNASSDPVLRVAVWRYCWGIATSSAHKSADRCQLYVDAIRTIAHTPLLQSYTSLSGLQANYALGAEVYPGGNLSGVDLDQLLDPGDGHRVPLTWAIVEAAAYWWRAYQLAFGIPPLASVTGEATTVPISQAAEEARAGAARVVERLLVSQ